MEINVQNAVLIVKLVQQDHKKMVIKIALVVIKNQYINI